MSLTNHTLGLTTDWCSEAGARQLAERIRDYWASQGKDGHDRGMAAMNARSSLAPFRTDSCDHNHSAKTQLRYPQNVAKKIVDLSRAYKMMCDSVADATIGVNRFRSQLDAP